eukprot:240341-Chlamydomonas_euryale.AAC.1
MLRTDARAGMGVHAHAAWRMCTCVSLGSSLSQLKGVSVMGATLGLTKRCLLSTRSLVWRSSATQALCGYCAARRMLAKHACRHMPMQFH